MQIFNGITDLDAPFKWSDSQKKILKEQIIEWLNHHHYLDEHNKLKNCSAWDAAYDMKSAVFSSLPRELELSPEGLDIWYDWLLDEVIVPILKDYKTDDDYDDYDEVGNE